MKKIQKLIIAHDRLYTSLQRVKEGIKKKKKTDPE